MASSGQMVGPETHIQAKKHRLVWDILSLGHPVEMHTKTTAGNTIWGAEEDLRDLEWKPLAEEVVVEVFSTEAMREIVGRNKKLRKAESKEKEWLILLLPFTNIAAIFS